MKKFIAAAMAAVLALGVQVTAFAASIQSQTKEITTLTGMPINEDGKQVSRSDSVAPNQKIYYLIPPQAANMLNNSKNFRLSVRKNTNSKLVKSVKLVEKKLFPNSKTNYYLPAAAGAIDLKKSDTYKAYPASSRHTYLEIQLNDTTSTDEFKVELTASFSARKAFQTPIQYADGSTTFFGNATGENKINPNDKLSLKVRLFVANELEQGDATVAVGDRGILVKPEANSENEITFESDDTFATLTFQANTDPDKFYAKLSTKWTASLLARFKNSDAVIRRFAPAMIDSSSRATLALNNPFDEEVDPKNVCIYTVNSKGGLVNATKKFVYNEDDDTFDTRTRVLGTYILSDVKIR